MLFKVATKARHDWVYLSQLNWRYRWVHIKRTYVPKLLFLFFLPLLLPASVLLRLVLITIKPFVHLRFARLWAFQLGQFTIPMELYLCKRDAGMYPKRSWDIFYHYDYEHYNRSLEHPIQPKDAVCNLQVDLMLQRKLRIWEPTRRLDQLNRLLSRGSQNFVVPGEPPGDPQGFLAQFPAHLEFTEQEEARGQEGLKQMGIEPETPFVCFNARDGVWLRQARPRLTGLYGEWGLVEFRNSSIKNYLLTADRFTDLGYYAIRIGKYVSEPIQPPNSRVIDYSTEFQSDFMDVYLSARCALFVGTNSGMTSLPMIFRRPMALVNVYPLSQIEYCNQQPGVFIPKLMYSAEKGRILTFREVMDLGLHHFFLRTQEDRDVYNRLGLEIVENSPEEILEASLELDQRLQSSFKPSNEDDDLQSRFLSLIRSYSHIIRMDNDMYKDVRIGAHFLRTHQSWLQ